MKIGSQSFPLIDVHTHVGVDQLFYFQNRAPYALGWTELVELGVGLGVDRFVVFPMPTHMGLNLEASWRGEVTDKGAWEKVPYSFENRRMMQEITRNPQSAGRAHPLWMFDPARAQQLQCEALRQLAAEFPCSGLKVQATIIRSPVSALLREGACLMDLAEEKDWPVLFHTSVHPDDPWSPVGDILKIAESHPGVRFNMAHSCRFDRPTLDRIAELSNVWFDCSAHAIHCALAAENHPAVAGPGRRFPSDYRDPVRVLADLAGAYPEKLIWGSDAPFYSYCDDAMTLSSSYASEVAILKSLGGSVVQRIGLQNSLAFLGRDLS